MALDKETIAQIKEQLLKDKEHLQKEILSDFTVKTPAGEELAFPDYGDHSGENARLNRIYHSFWNHPSIDSSARLDR